MLKAKILLSEIQNQELCSTRLAKAKKKGFLFTKQFAMAAPLHLR